MLSLIRKVIMVGLTVVLFILLVAVRQMLRIAVSMKMLLIVESLDSLAEWLFRDIVAMLFLKIVNLRTTGLQAVVPL